MISGLVSALVKTQSSSARTICIVMSLEFVYNTRDAHAMTRQTAPRHVVGLKTKREGLGFFGQTARRGVCCIDLGLSRTRNGLVQVVFLNRRCRNGLDKIEVISLLKQG